MNNKKCTICGFERGVAAHHIVKRKEGGSDELENIVYLCPNHHWIADFGTDIERKEVLELIKKITGKCGKEIEGKERKILEDKIRVLVEEGLCIFQREERKKFSDEEWEDMKNTSNYSSTMSWLLGRGCSPIQSSLLNRRAEILLIINKLKEEIIKTQF